MLLPVLAGAALWLFGPAWIAPNPDFPQGPGGALAYVSIANQLRTQAKPLAQGEPVRVVLTESEFSGMIASALLSGRRFPGLEPKVRTVLADDLIRLESVVTLADERVPKRFQGPVGIHLEVEPQVEPGTPLKARIRRAAVGRIPLSPGLIRWVSRTTGLMPPGYDPEGPAVIFPVESLVAQAIGRKVSLQGLTVAGKQVTLTVTASPAH